MKKEAEELITEYIKHYKLKEIPESWYPVKITYIWVEKNKKRDIDNVCFSKKFINDALVKNEILKNDSYQYVRELQDLFFIDKDNPRIIISIEPTNKAS